MGDEFCCDEFEAARREKTIMTTSGGDELFVLTDEGRMFIRFCPFCGERVADE